MVVNTSTLIEVTQFGTVVWSVTGTVAGGVASLMASNPSPPTSSGVIWASQITVTLNVAACGNATAQETDVFTTYNTFGQVTGSQANPPRNTVWTRTSDPPGLTVTADIMAGTVTTQLTGQNKAALLSITIADSNGNITTLANHNNAQSGNTFAGDSLKRTQLSPGPYGTVSASWDSNAVNVPVSFYVVGNTRFSQYNTPYSSDNTCNSAPQLVHVINKTDANNCYWKDVSLPSTFVRQVLQNGTGVMGASEIIKAYNAGAATTCGDSGRALPSPLTSQNTFFSVDAGGIPITKILGAAPYPNNSPLSDATGTASAMNNNNPPMGSVAVKPPGGNYPETTQVADPFVFGDQILLVGAGDVNDARGPRSVQDLCPACLGGFGPPNYPGTVAHIDAYSSGKTCSVGTDYGEKTVIRLR